MSDRALAYVVEFPGTNGDSEVWKSTHRTAYWESIGSAFQMLGFFTQRSQDLNAGIKVKRDTGYDE